MHPRVERWVAVGASADPNPVRAAIAAVGSALAHDDPQLIVLFASDAYDLEILVATAYETGGGAQLIGCSTAGEIATDGPGEASVVCAAFGGPGFDVATAVGENASQDLRGAGVAAAACAARPGEPRSEAHRALILLSDGLAGDQQEVVRGAHSVVGSGVPLVGGCAGDDLKMERTHQFLGDRVYEDAVVAAALASDAPLGIGVRHGWRRVGRPMVVTDSIGTQVLTLDDRPAVDVYLERLQAPAEVRCDAGAFSRLGLSRRAGEENVRFVSGADFSSRSLACLAEVPKGALVWLMEGDAGSVLAATDAACEAALAGLEGHAPLGILAFDCIARRDVLGVGIGEEVQRLAAVAGVPVAGFYTYGEIARTRGLAGFHNQTLVVLAVA
jgi:hypothetical protein